MTNRLNGYSKELQSKIDLLLKNQSPIKLGKVNFSNNLILAPMASITYAPFRLLMQSLGSGGSVSELISCHGINYSSDKTLHMLTIWPEEKNVGIQLFGEDSEAMARAAVFVEENYHPDFIDINMGCPVRKVLGKGGGSALLKEIKILPSFLKQIKSSIKTPLTIKIRTGWDEENINADEIINIAKNEGVEFVALHGRTRSQQYSGNANWELIEKVHLNSPLPLIGNGDLHSPNDCWNVIDNNYSDAFMLGRGPLHDPFLFLKSLDRTQKIHFTPRDHLEVITYFNRLLKEFITRDRTHLITIRKQIIWVAYGFKGASKFRSELFKLKDVEEILKRTSDFFLSMSQNEIKGLPEKLLSSGHG